jgi:hypothetical protein
VAPVGETLIRFFSFFTILTNLLAAIYFTLQAMHHKTLSAPGALTAIAVYITIVGVVYQVLLRHVWQPTGLQMVVDELLHSLNPVLVIGYWALYEQMRALRYNQFWRWLIYPLGYLVFILIRGYFSRFYPYPFIHAAELGYAKTFTNAFLLLLFFAAVSLLFLFIAKQSGHKKEVTPFIKKTADR